MYNPSPYSPRQEVTTPDAVSNPRCLRAHGFTAALPDTRYPASGKILKQLRVAARNPIASESKGPVAPVRECRHGAALASHFLRDWTPRKSTAHRHACKSLFVNARCERVSRKNFCGAAHDPF